MVLFSGRIGAFVVMKYLGRKTAFIAALGFASVCTFVSIWDNDDSRKVMYCFGKVGYASPYCNFQSFFVNLHRLGFYFSVTYFTLIK